MKLMVKHLCVAVLAAGLLAGCAAGPSEDKPIEQVKKEAESMDSAKLEAMVQKYETAIKAKSSEIEKLTAKLKEIPIKDLIGEEAKAIKDEVGEITKSVSALKDRMAVYAGQLKAEMKEAVQ